MTIIERRELQEIINGLKFYEVKNIFSKKPTVKKKIDRRFKINKK